MKLVLALGNPGDEYRDTRHNVGWWLADRLVARWSLPPFDRRGSVGETRGRSHGEPVRVVKPLTYVNRSGAALRSVRDRDGFRPERDLLVLVDDVWLEPGRFRLRARGSSGGHRGLDSVERALGGPEYGRLRIGVGRPPDPEVDLAEWVLSPLPAAEEERVVAEFDGMAAAVERWLEDGIEAAMNRFNR